MVHHKQKTSGAVKMVQYFTKQTSWGSKQRRTVVDQSAITPTKQGRLSAMSTPQGENTGATVFDMHPIPLALPSGKVSLLFNNKSV
jgi:hypothetical protein